MTLAASVPGWQFGTSGGLVYSAAMPADQLAGAAGAAGKDEAAAGLAVALGVGLGVALAGVAVGEGAGVGVGATTTALPVEVESPPPPHPVNNSGRIAAPHQRASNVVMPGACTRVSLTNLFFLQPSYRLAATARRAPFSTGAI